MTKLLFSFTISAEFLLLRVIFILAGSVEVRKFEKKRGKQREMIDVKATPEDPRGYYFLLGLEKNATSVEVRKAYKKAAVVKRDTHSF